MKLTIDQLFKIKPSFPAVRLLVVGLLLLTTGCGSDGHQDLENFIAEVKARGKGVIEPLPEVKTFETFIFDEASLRDPFVASELNQGSVGLVGGQDGPHPDSVRRKEALESYPLDSLQMMGTVELKGLYWGLVKAGDGAIHRVLVGNYLGMNHGKINRIVSNKIELTEIISDGVGGWSEQQESLVLAE